MRAVGKGRIPLFGPLLALLGAGMAPRVPAAESPARPMALYVDADVPPAMFAAHDVRAVLEAQGIPVRVLPLSAAAGAAHEGGVVIAHDEAGAARLADAFALKPPRNAAPQSYALRVRGSGARRLVAVLGADPAGAMYGGLDVAEAFRLGTADALADSDHSPYLERRGLKFNCPLDLRTPSYSDCSDAFQANIPDMWDLVFWRSLFDEMARCRFNVLTLWSLHPFPSLVKVPEFPEVALDDVWRTRRPFDDTFSHNGRDMVRPAMLEDVEIVRRMTIDDKIRFWRAVMAAARDRGIEVYWFTWNIFTFGAEGKHGITPDQTNETTIAYFRASVRELVRTYPLLAGIGITAGEQMKRRDDAYAKETWLWRTYGEGVRDALRDTPERPFRVIHRFHQTALGEIAAAWENLPCTLELSFKYSIAHMYSIPRPPFIDAALPSLGPDRRTWLTVRNDDIYSFRWGDPSFARAFLQAVPAPGEKVVGYYMGPDGYCWGRDYLSREGPVPRPLVMQRQAYSFLLWGRLSYDPALPDALFERIVSARFPDADGPALFRAWSSASKVFPLITSFFWGDIDIRWYPEACMSHRKHRGFYTVRDFMEGQTMPGSGLLSILEWRAARNAGGAAAGRGPLEVAGDLETAARSALEGVGALRKGAGGATGEYANTLDDLEAMAELGLYYADKIRGAAALAVYDGDRDAAQHAEALARLESALSHWRRYAGLYARQYRQPVLYNRVGWVDIPGFAKQAEEDIALARAWPPGTLRAPSSRRAADAPFRP